MVRYHVPCGLLVNGQNAQNLAMVEYRLGRLPARIVILVNVLKGISLLPIRSVAKYRVQNGLLVNGQNVRNLVTVVHKLELSHVTIVVLVIAW